MEYEILKTEGRAKRARVSTVHGEIQTPVFMNVGTVAAIKGAVSTMDLIFAVKCPWYFCLRVNFQFGSSEIVNVFRVDLFFQVKKRGNNAL